MNFANTLLILVTFLMTLTVFVNTHRGQSYSQPHNWRRDRPQLAFRSPFRNRTALTSSQIIACENKILNELYKKSLAEGGQVIIYAGGDTAGQQDYVKGHFEKKFPNVTLHMIVDYSKFHNGRIDNQLATHSLVPDVVQLQTLQDFPRWKSQGILLPYKPIWWDKVHNEFKDLEGYFTGIYIIAFTNIINKKLMPNNATWPTEAKDYLRPEFTGKLVVTYPNDDDAILFWFKQIVDKYGWSYVEEFAAQAPILVRGTQEPFDAADAGRTPASPAVASSPKNLPTSNTAFILPKNDPFMTWPQTAAIFKNARHPETAKLYLSWILSYEFQTELWDLWSVRRDGNNPKNLKGIFEYPGQTDVMAFGKWMGDRGQVERFRSQLTMVMGEVKGEPSPGHLGSHPVKAEPH